MKEARHILAEALSERSANNPSYSLRAFARDIGISPQLLSNVINGKRGMGNDLALKVVNKLDLSENEKLLFLESLKAKFSRSKAQKIIAQAKLSSFRNQGPSKSLELDLFKIISNWYHFALLELIKISKSKDHQIAWFSKKLGISENEVLMALGRLERLELISRTQKKWKVNQDTLIADQGVASEAVRSFHRQVLEKATQALSLQSSAERYGSSSMMPIRVKDLERAKKMIKDFRLKFDREISDIDEGEEVYAFSVQFFRLTQNKETTT